MRHHGRFRHAHIQAEQADSDRGRAAIGLCNVFYAPSAYLGPLKCSQVSSTTDRLCSRRTMQCTV